MLRRYVIESYLMFSPLLLALTVGCVVSLVNLARGSRKAVFGVLGFGLILLGDLLGPLQVLAVPDSSDHRWLLWSRALSFGIVLMFALGITSLILAIFGPRLKAPDLPVTTGAVPDVALPNEPRDPL